VKRIGEIRISYERLALAYRYVVCGDYQLEGLLSEAELMAIRFADTYWGTVKINDHLQLFEERNTVRRCAPEKVA